MGADVEANDDIAVADYSASETRRLTAKDLVQNGLQLIDDDVILGQKLVTDSVTALQIAPDAITASELADDAVDTTAIQDSAVVNAKVAVATLTGDRLVADTITANEIAPDAITSSELADDAVDTTAIQDLAVIDAKIADGIDGTKIADGTVTDAELAFGIDGAKLIADSVTAAEIAPDAITSSELADLSVDTAAIQDLAVTDAKIASGVDGAKITDDTLTAIKINASSFDRGLDKSTGQIGITNNIGVGGISGIAWDEQGLITSGVPLVSSDLPPATAAEIGGVSIPLDSGLTVTAAGALDHVNNVTIGLVSGITYDEHGHIVTAVPLTDSDLPTATTTAKGAVSVPGPTLEVDGIGQLTHADSGVAPGSYPKVTVDQDGHVTDGLALDPADIPDLDASIITTGEFDGDALLADRSVTRQKIADYAISYIQEAEPASDNSAHNGCLWYQESTAQLRMWNQNSWMPVGFGRLSADNLRFGGTIDASTGLVTNVTDDATTAGIAVGDPLPVATDTLGGLYFVVDVAGLNINVFDVVGVPFDAADWVLCISAATGWTRIDVAGGGGGGATVLDDLLDVTITGLAADQLLSYNGVTAQWNNVVSINGGTY